MVVPLMPKATALWLVENTTLTFEQIATFCELHLLEVQAIADGEIGVGLVPFDPLANNQLTPQEIKRCEEDSSKHLILKEHESVLDKNFKKGRYTPVSLRKDRPDGIAWILKHYPQMNDALLCRLLGTTKATIEAIRNKTHKKALNIKPRHPVTLGLCTQKDLDQAVEEALKTNSEDNLI
ncbi:MAG: cytoplasmic protein [Caedibacter sp. 38-128]|nr:DUF1013 domain-containing protein [Holosporales bacterium]OJX03232.1 MAG: cytoplasmic protein [Caedibacter sp. 38-128]